MVITVQPTTTIANEPDPTETITSHTPEALEPETSDGGLSTDATAGIAAGVVIGVLLIAAILFRRPIRRLIYKAWPKAREEQEQGPGLPELEDGATAGAIKSDATDDPYLPELGATSPQVKQRTQLWELDAGGTLNTSTCPEIAPGGGEGVPYGEPPAQVSSVEVPSTAQSPNPQTAIIHDDTAHQSWLSAATAAVQNTRLSEPQSAGQGVATEGTLATTHSNVRGVSAPGGAGEVDQAPRA